MNELSDLMFKREELLSKANSFNMDMEAMKSEFGFLNLPILKKLCIVYQRQIFLN